MKLVVLALVVAVFLPDHFLESRGCNVWKNPTTVDICSDSSTVYPTAAAAEAAPPASYADVAAAQTATYSVPFTCNNICPLGEIPGCQKSNRFTDGSDASVSAVPVPGGFKSRTCYTGATREEGCRKCIPIQP